MTATVYHPDFGSKDPVTTDLYRAAEASGDPADRDLAVLAARLEAASLRARRVSFEAATARSVTCIARASGLLP